jgi:nitroreductase
MPYEPIVEAVRDALRAPSVFNTQPWRWGIDAGGLELRAEWSRQLCAVDPYGHELLLSCGVALHHALVSLGAQGWAYAVERYGDDGDRLARIRLLGRADPDPFSVTLRDAIAARRTDRRPYSDRPVPAATVDEMIAAAVSAGARLHRVRYDQMPMFAVAVAFAGATETADPAYLGDLARWTKRPQWTDDGVSLETGVRRVPVREFALNPLDGMAVEPGGDLGAAYLVLHGPGTTRTDRLRAGEAFSAVLLTAVAHGLRVAPITDVIEVDHPRDLVRGLLPERDEPYAALRCGYPIETSEVPASPRRRLRDVLESRP